MVLRLTWSARRQILYYGVAFIVLGLGGWAAYQTFFTSSPNCHDGVQNQNERGVDCGGSCSLVCPADSHAPTVLWDRSFEVTPGRYTAAAYIQNNTVSAGARSVPYSFQLFDDQNVFVTERDGVIDLPPVQTIPIVETGIDVGNRTVSHTQFCFGYQSQCLLTQSAPPVWYAPTHKLPVLRITNQSLAADGTRLSATLVNDTLQDVSRVTVAAVLFDSSGTARAASKSVLSVPQKGSAQAVFTWPKSTPDVVRAEITVLPPF